MNHVLLAALLCFVLAAPVLADTVSERIISASESGQLSTDQTALYLVYSILDPGALPADYTDGADAERCGTVALHEAELLLDQVSAPIRGEILTLLARPGLSGPEYTFNSPGDFFKMHWTDSGADAVTLSYAQDLATYFDYCYDEECGTLGYIKPPPDNYVGGDNRYDIYILECGGSTLGYCSSGGEYKPPDSTHSCSASYIAMDNDNGVNWCKVTAAHEFQHAIQMSYDYQEPTWFMENCAVWIEDIVYDDINDYVSYLTGGENPIRRPWFDIRSQAMYWYGASIYPRYMWLRIDIDAVREVWELCAATIGINMLPAQQDMYSNHGMTWEQGFMEYSCWRWFVKNNWYAGCGLYDDEATMWGTPYVFSYHNHTSLPASGDEGVYPPDTYGIVWIKVDLQNYQDGWIEMAFDGRDYFEWNLGAIMWSESGDHEYVWYDCDPTSGDLNIAVSGAGWDWVIFVPAFMTETSLTHYYDYSITYQTGVEEGTETPQMLDLRVSANPLSAGGTIQFDIPTASTARLDVFDLSGRMVTTLFDDTVAAGTHTVGYNGGLSRGTYFLRLYSGNQISTVKIVLAE
jgi:hypothetical protein